jgi:hypothetical protein
MTPAKEEIVRLVKQKEEYRNISDKIIFDCFEDKIKKYKIPVEEFRERDKKLIVKEIREALRKLTSRFSIRTENRAKSLENEDYFEILKSHMSTKERIDDYPILIAEIEKIKPERIIDLGCGLNPLRIAKPGIEYNAYDIQENELEIVRRYFEKNKIFGKVEFLDARKITNGLLPETDLCIVMKVFDVLETRGHKIAEKIIDNINSNNWIISFSTKTLSGKPMNHPQRGWIERLLERKKFLFSIIKTKNEIFYIAKKVN